MVAEAGLGELIKEVLPLGFGKCKLQVQVPEKGGMEDPRQLVGRKVVTSFERLARQYFGRLDGEAGLDHGEGKTTNERVKRSVEVNGSREHGRQATTIERIGGSVEAACALGLADGIVDLVGAPYHLFFSVSSARTGLTTTGLAMAESGETMRAAGLKPIATLLESQAVLISSSRGPPAEHARLVSRLTSRIAGVIAAKRYVLCYYNLHRSNLPEAKKITPGRRAATVSPLEEEGMCAVNAMIEKKEAADIMDRLEAIGATDIFITELVEFFPCSLGLPPLVLARSLLKSLAFCLQSNCRV